MGGVPDQPPAFAVSVSPTTGEPVIDGGTRLFGFALPCTIPVGLDAADAWPSEFVAITRTRRRRPMSASRTRYVLFVAFPITRQFEPSAAPPSVPQRSHRYANDIGVDPDHEPVLADRSRPFAASPVMRGSAVFAGAAFALAAPEPGSTAAATAATTASGATARSNVRVFLLRIACIDVHLLASLFTSLGRGTRPRKPGFAQVFPCANDSLT